MSSDFYFKKWKKTLVELEAIVKLDVEFQETKAHDKKRCEATQRLSGMLGRYTTIYNEIWECLHQNLQVQKTRYIHDVLKAVVSRILELKHELRKLEQSEYNFNSNGLVYHKLTPYEVELDEIPDRNERPESIQAMIEDIFKQVKERKKQLEEEAAIEEVPEIVEKNWWEMEIADSKNNSDNDDDDDNKDFNTYEKKVIISQEQQEINNMAIIIQAQEKTRQVINGIRIQRSKRQRWIKELSGILPPPAPYEIRERGAKLIQKVYRAFIESKREKHKQYKREEILGMRPCLKSKLENKEKFEQVKANRTQLKRKYDEEWKIECETLKQEYLNKKGDDIREHCRDHIRDWFKIWFEAIQFFHEIPGQKQGGAALIFKEELPTPEEWLEEYKVYLAEKTANKNKTALDKKFAKLEAKREEMERKREEHLKEKMEKELRRKMMKNPTLHPGFCYPESKRTEHILEVIGYYYKDWADLDATEKLDVKEKSVRDIDISNAYMEVKLEMIASVEQDMRKELKRLKKALKKDYKNNDEKMPETMKKNKKKQKKKGKGKKAMNVDIAKKLEDLVFRGYVTEYPKIKIEEFIGDPNFTGDDMRCDNVTALPQNGEMRNVWWERCRELSHTCNKILLVGPKGSGKTRLAYILATMNDAVLFELDPETILGELVTGDFLDNLVLSVATCAKAVQPSVICIKHVHRLYYRKVPPEYASVDWNLIQRYFIKKLFRNIHKKDKVTIIGTCVDPWLTKSKTLLKKFPTVILVPNTSYGTVVQILKNWVLSYNVIPTDFNVSSLAYVLRRYSFGFIKNSLEKFMSADTIVRVAALGISPMDVYKFILQDETEGQVDYEKYLKWYTVNTTWGKKEKKHLDEQREFQQAMANYLERREKQKKTKVNQNSSDLIEEKEDNDNEA